MRFLFPTLLLAAVLSAPLYYITGTSFSKSLLYLKMKKALKYRFFIFLRGLASSLPEAIGLLLTVSSGAFHLAVMPAPRVLGFC